MFGFFTKEDKNDKPKKKKGKHREQEEEPELTHSKEYSVDDYPILISNKRKYNANALLSALIAFIGCCLAWSYFNFGGIISIFALYIGSVARIQIHHSPKELQGVSWANTGIILSFVGFVVNWVYLTLKLFLHII